MLKLLKEVSFKNPWGKKKNWIVFLLYTFNLKKDTEQFDLMIW